MDLHTRRRRTVKLAMALQASQLGALRTNLPSLCTALGKVGLPLSELNRWSEQICRSSESAL